MDFGFTEAQSEVQNLARKILSEQVTPEKLAAFDEYQAQRFDRDLWQQLSEAGLLGVAIGEEYGGILNANEVLGDTAFQRSGGVLQVQHKRPLAGYEGIFDGRLDGAGRVQILLAFLGGHPQRVQLDGETIRKKRRRRR